MTPKGVTAWVAPGGIWFELWHFVDEHKLNAKTTVYLLTEKTQSS